MIGISYIITTYHRNELLLKAIDSVIEERVLPSELIIVDDCGTKPVEIPTDLQNRFDHNIRLIRNAQNKGVIEARNVGIAAAKYDYILFLDDDDVSFPNRSKDLLPYIKEKNYAFVAGKCQMHSRQTTEIIPRTTHRDLTPLSYLRTFPHINGIIFQKSKLVELGGLDNRVPHLGEHITLQRLLLRGEKGLQTDHIVARFESIDDGLTAKVLNNNKMRGEFIAFFDALLPDVQDTKYEEAYLKIRNLLPQQTLTTVDDYLDFVTSILQNRD
jgi:glycosyltransferase involved in cell wall biosynthesis